MFGKIAGILFLLAASIAAQAAASAPDSSAVTDDGVRGRAAPPSLGIAAAPVEDARAVSTGRRARTVMGISVTVVAAPDMRSHTPAKPAP